MTIKSKKNSLRKNQKSSNKQKKEKILNLEQYIFGTSKIVRNKNFINKVKWANKNGYTKIIVDNYPDPDDVYNVKSLIKKINLNNKHLLKY